MKTVALGPFSGMNNRLPDAQLQTSGANGRKTGDYLRNAVNVDLTNAGTPRRRTGTSAFVDGTDVHSLWADEKSTFYIDGTDLCTLSAVQEKQVVRSGLTPGARASFARVADDIYWSNSSILERITNNVSSTAGIPVPNPEPIITAGTGGSLPAGTYQVAISAVSATLEESGSTWPIMINVPENGVINLSAIPVTSYGTNIFITPANGDLLFFADMLLPGVTSYTFSVTPELGRQLQTFGLRPMPPGHIVREFNARLLVASGNVLFYSEPYAPALRNPARGYISFPEKITIVQPGDDGVYVVSDRTYWVSGADIDKSEIIPTLPYGAVEGTGGSATNEDVVWWFSERGLVVADMSGKVKNVQEDAVAVDHADFGAGIFREQNGVRQIISSLFGAEASTAAANSFMEAEIVRKESICD